MIFWIYPPCLLNPTCCFADFGRIPQVPAYLWRASPGRDGLEFARWSLVVCALIFFLFFGFAEEARKHYKGAVGSISKRVGISPSNTFIPGHKFGSVTSSVGYVIALKPLLKLVLTIGISQFEVSSTNKSANSRFSGPVVIPPDIFEKRNSAISFTSVGDTEVGTLRTPSRGNTPSKNSLINVPNSPTSPSFRLSVPSATHESFLEFSSSDREIAPTTVHRV
jgi:pheromone a factor receptor